MENGHNQASGNKKPFCCSFCGRSQDEVKRLVSGQQPDAFICNDCVELCADLLDEVGLSTKSIATKTEAKMLDNIRELKENVRQSTNAVMENRLTASHLASDVYVLLEYLDKLEAMLL